MAEFPAKVSTETSSPQAASGGGRFHSFTSRYISMDMSFIRTVPAVLMLVEIGLGLLVWALIASSSYTQIPAYGWVMFVSVMFWLLTIVLFLILFLGIQNKMSFVPWPLALLVFNIMATLFYLTAFITNAASVYNSPQGAAAFFAIVVTLAYGVSTFFAFTLWRGDGGNAATNTVPA